MYKIKIREARYSDKLAIVNLIKSFLTYDGRFAKRYYENYFEDNRVTGEDLVLVAEVDKEVVGVIGYCEDYFSNDYSYHLTWFVVDEKFRGWRKGIVAKRLITKIEKDLRRYKVKKIFVSTEDRPDRCHVFYIKHGFQFEARLKDYYGKNEDKIIFGKEL